MNEAYPTSPHERTKDRAAATREEASIRNSSMLAN